MSNTKSLGSSPIGYYSGDIVQFHFIPDLGPVKTKESSVSTEYSSPKEEEEYQPRDNKTEAKNPPQPEKKIASYNLETCLIERLKAISDEHGIYYSQFVSDAISKWIEEHDY